MFSKMQLMVRLSLGSHLNHRAIFILGMSRLHSLTITMPRCIMGRWCSDLMILIPLKKSMSLLSRSWRISKLWGFPMANSHTLRITLIWLSIMQGIWLSVTLPTWTTPMWKPWESKDSIKLSLSVEVLLLRKIWRFLRRCWWGKLMIFASEQR